MAADLATLSVKIEHAQALAATTQIESAFGRLKSAAAELGLALSIGGLFREFMTASVETQSRFAQLEAGVRSTGGAAGFTAEQLRSMSAEMQKLTGFSDEAIQGAQAVFLMFQSLRGEQFTQATQAAADLAVRLGTDVPEAARQLGKALEDPERGLLALRRAGVILSESQVDLVKKLEATGHVEQAQRLILDAVTAKVGGSAAAFRDTLGGALANLKNVWNDLFEVTKEDSRGIIDAINSVANVVPKIRDAFSAFFGWWALTATRAAIDVQRAFLTVKDGVLGVVGVFGALTNDPKLTAWAAVAIEQNKVLWDGLKALEAQELATALATGKHADAIKRVVDANAPRIGKLPSDLPTGIANLGEKTDSQKQAEAWLRDYLAYWDKRNAQEQKGIDDTKKIEAAFDAWLHDLRVKGETKAEDDKKAIRENFLRQFQQTFANGIAQMLESGLTSWRSFFDTIKSYFIKLVADMAAQKLTEKIFGGASGSAGGGMLGSVKGGVWAAVGATFLTVG